MKALSFLLAAPLLVGMAFGAAGCGGIDSRSSKGDDSSNDAGSTDDGGSFPLGAYSDCQWLVTGGTFESASSPATLTLGPICSASGCAASAMVASFQSGQATTTFTLHATSDSSATLSGPGQGFSGEWGFCGGGAVQLDGGGIAVADPAPAEATLSLTSAELTIDQGVAFLQLDGPVVDIQGSPGCTPDVPPSSGLSALLVCDVSNGNGVGNAPAATTTTSRFAAGAYACSSTAEFLVSYQGEEDHSSIGGSGTLTLTANGASLEAVYSGDTNASGTLEFVVTSDSSANPVPGQTITVGCGAIDPTTLMQVNAPTPGNVNAAALTTDGTALYLTFLSKTSGGACANQTASTVLVCMPKG
ncbi:MAG TPA: hypothetical protein VGL81_01930 [Polyangiaceae bacterium]|jgi:hypothetical protein